MSSDAGGCKIGLEIVGGVLAGAVASRRRRLGRADVISQTFGIGGQGAVVATEIVGIRTDLCSRGCSSGRTWTRGHKYRLNNTPIDSGAFRAFSEYSLFFVSCCTAACYCPRPLVLGSGAPAPAAPVSLSSECIQQPSCSWPATACLGASAAASVLQAAVSSLGASRVNSLTRSASVSVTAVAVSSAASLRYCVSRRAGPAIGRTGRAREDDYSNSKQLTNSGFQRSQTKSGVAYIGH